MDAGDLRHADVRRPKRRTAAELADPRQRGVDVLDREVDEPGRHHPLLQLHHAAVPMPVVAHHEVGHRRASNGSMLQRRDRRRSGRASVSAE